MQEVLRAGAEGERKWQRTGRLDRGSDPLQRGGELIDGLSGAPAGILDGTTDQTGLGGQADGRGAVLRSIAVAVFQVGGDRQIGGGDDRSGVFQRLSPAHRAFRIAPAQGERQACAGGGKGVEAEAGEHLRRTGIPGIGQDQHAGPLVQVAETFGALALAGHGGGLRGGERTPSLGAGRWSVERRAQSRPSCSTSGAGIGSGSAGKPGRRWPSSAWKRWACWAAR